MVFSKTIFVSQKSDKLYFQHICTKDTNNYWFSEISKLTFQTHNNSIYDFFGCVLDCSDHITKWIDGTLELSRFFFRPIGLPEEKLPGATNWYSLLKLFWPWFGFYTMLRCFRRRKTFKIGGIFQVGRWVFNGQGGWSGEQPSWWCTNLLFGTTDSRKTGKTSMMIYAQMKYGLFAIYLTHNASFPCTTQEGRI